ncbi:MAG: AEC family transporter, partial [Verrucomicrobiota bacterium]
AVADRFLRLDRKSLSQFNVYLLLPALFFTTLMKVEVDGIGVLRVAGFTAMILSSMAMVGWAWSRFRKLDQAATSSAVLSTTFFNGVNLGFPIAGFAFGERGLLLASVLVAVNALPHNGIGMFIAARGALSTSETFRALFRMPFLYVIALALLLRVTGMSVPGSVMKPIESLGMAALPFTLVCIGMELARLELGRPNVTVTGLVLLRLLLAPLVAIGAAQIAGLSGLLRDVVILQASMPSAIAPIVYARCFGGNVDLLSKVAFYSTIGSLVSLPFLLRYLGAGN